MPCPSLTQPPHSPRCETITSSSQRPHGPSQSPPRRLLFPTPPILLLAHLIVANCCQRLCAVPAQAQAPGITRFPARSAPQYPAYALTTASIATRSPLSSEAATISTASSVLMTAMTARPSCSLRSAGQKWKLVIHGQYVLHRERGRDYIVLCALPDSLISQLTRTNNPAVS